MLSDATLTALHVRLAAALAPAGGPLLQLVVDGHAVGCFDAARAARLEGFGDVFVRTGDVFHLHPNLGDEASRSAAFAEVARDLASEGALTAWRDELYAVGPAGSEAPLFLLERAAARYFGIETRAVHVNGLAAHYGDLGMWLARRSAGKAIDPGLLDNLVGGGVRAGSSIQETLVREAWEEAGIEASVAARAQPVGLVRVVRHCPDGLERETIYVSDLRLPGTYTPTGIDGEAEHHRLVDLEEAATLITRDDGPDVVTVDASLVILDCLLRHGRIAADSPHFAALALLRTGAA